MALISTPTIACSCALMWATILGTLCSQNWLNDHLPIVTICLWWTPFWGPNLKFYKLNYFCTRTTWYNSHYFGIPRVGYDPGMALKAFPSSIGWDSNPQPFNRELSLLTTRPDFRTSYLNFYQVAPTTSPKQHLRYFTTDATWASDHGLLRTVRARERGHHFLRLGQLHLRRKQRTRHFDWRVKHYYK